MKIKTIFFAITLVLASFLVPTHTADAQSEGSVLFVSPHRVDIGPEDRVTRLTVANKSDIKRRYNIQIVDQVMDETGATRRLEGGFEYSAKKMLKFVPKRFTLEPGQRQIVRVQVRRPKTLTDGDYHSHLLFREVPLKTENRPGVKAGDGKVSFEIKTLYGIAVPVVLKHGHVQSNMTVTDLSFGKSEGGKDIIRATFNRDGNGEASTLLTITHKKGDQVTDIVPSQWVRMYREVDQIVKDIPLALPEGYNLSGGTVQATLTINPDKTDETVVSTKEVAGP